MKPKSAYHFSLAILGVGLTGCVSSSVSQLGDAYEEVVYTTKSIIFEPDAHRSALQYRTATGKRIMIWPSVGGTFIRGEIAVFVAYKEGVNTGEPIFAVKPPAPPLEITSEILLRWSRESGRDDAKARQMASIAYIVESVSGLEIHFVFWGKENWPDTIFRLDWNQISDIMREVKEKGVVRKDRVWHTTYIEKEFEPEVQQ